jgi:hypothetical protein
LTLKAGLKPDVRNTVNLMSKIPIKNSKGPHFDGVHDSTTFIVDQDTKKFQYGIETIDKNTYEMTIAAIDAKEKRKEYVMTINERQLRSLHTFIGKILRGRP